MFSEVGKMKKNKYCVLRTSVLVAFLAVSLPAFSTINIAAIQMDIESATWYSSNEFQLENLFNETVMLIDTGDIRAAGSVEYEYAFEGSVEITPSDELWPLGEPQGSVLTGVFSDSGSAGASTITVTATRVWAIDAPEVDILTNVVLITAQMANPENYWFVNESSTGVNNYQGTTSYQITGGELFNGSVMRLDDFAGYYSFPGSTPVTNFGPDMSSSAPAIDLIDSDAVPEPATLLLLGLGGLLMRKK
jgi:hypothetical protein